MIEPTQNAPRRAWTVEELQSLTVEELTLAIALKQYQGISIPALVGAAPGSGLVAPVVAMGPARTATLAVAKPRKPSAEVQLPDNVAKMRKRCPRCGETKNIGTGFGPRMTASGKVLPQSYCRECRSKPQKAPALKK